MGTPPTALVILDGFGWRTESTHNAIAQARMPHLKQWLALYPHTFLQAAGEAVGLPAGYIGNSEVGHLTLGAGRVIEQPLTQIYGSIEDRSFFKNPILVNNLEKLRQRGGALHVMGLLSDAGVHSSLELLYAVLDAAHQHAIHQVYIHAFLDGRDMPPRSAYSLLEQLENALTACEFGSIGSLHGRFYAMDRDNNWQRTMQSYFAMAQEFEGIPRPWELVLEKQYAEGITDEFFVPTLIDPTATIQPGDGILFFNIRPDRARQLTTAFVNPERVPLPIRELPLSFFITPVEYGASLHTSVLYPREPVHNTLKDILAACGKRIFSIAETEKYAHVTYFFVGGREGEVKGEKQLLIPSLKATTYAEHPCMSAAHITDAVIDSFSTDPYDFYLINYANADMVGHSGDFQATVKAVECLDRELGRLYEIIVKRMGGTLFITGDHGKAEDMFDEKAQQPRTAHTANPVPFIMIKKGVEKDTALPLTGLADVAGLVLKEMGIEQEKPR